MGRGASPCMVSIPGHLKPGSLRVVCASWGLPPRHSLGPVCVADPSSGHKQVEGRNLPGVHLWGGVGARWVTSQGLLEHSKVRRCLVAFPLLPGQRPRMTWGELGTPATKSRLHLHYQPACTQFLPIVPCTCLSSGTCRVQQED